MQGAARWATLFVATAALAIGAVGACGGSDLKQSGESCIASSECDRGLVCDFGREPHVCATMATQNDAAPDEDAGPDDAGLDAPPDGRVIDARVIDARVIDAPPPPDAAIDASLIDAP